MNFFKSHKKITIALSLTLALLIGIGLSFCSPTIFSRKNTQFQTFTEQLFKNEITANTLNLHYTLANPTNFNIQDYPITYGALTFDTTSDIATLENLKSTLSTFSSSQLSTQNTITLDLLNLYIDTELSAAESPLLNELLSPTLGVQAQLPVLLAEYTFRTKTDIEDYLSLISTTDTYFNQILDFENEKAKQGCFMSTKACENIIAQCSSFIQNPETNYLITVFNNKINNIKNLTTIQKEDYIKRHTQAILTHVIPAYQSLMDGLTQLKPYTKNENGLFYLEQGKQYYEYLIKSTTGVYDSIDTIRVRLLKQLTEDYQEIREIISKNPSVLTISDPLLTAKNTPLKMLETLKDAMINDFPALEDATYAVKDVDKSLEDYLSPAFYLTPPIDDSSSNTIYVNGAANMKGIELFTTLAHEGFPGHLYQTLYFAQTDPDYIRHIFSCGGYVEGWATYVESYGYQYGAADPNYGRVLWLNRSLNLALCSLLDLGIHYYGWTESQCQKFLNEFGITDATQIQNLFQNIVETPANYLKYYLGFLNFQDLKNEMQQKLGDDFNLQEFHKNVLEIGPVPFPILRKYLAL